MHTEAVIPLKLRDPDMARMQPCPEGEKKKRLCQPRLSSNKQKEHRMLVSSKQRVLMKSAINSLIAVSKAVT